MNNVEIGRKGEIKENLPLPDGYTEDGRLPLRELYKAYDRLVNEFGWERELVYTQILETPQGKLEFPIYEYRTPKEGPAFWILGGIHGEEPAGPNAFAENIDVIAKLGRTIPVVFIPLCSPSAYFRDYRYEDEERNKKLGHSVGDAEFLLLPLGPNIDPNKIGPRTPESDNNIYLPAAKALVGKVLELSSQYPPFIWIDHHEDEALDAPYIYSQGLMEFKDPVAIEIVKILERSGLPVKKGGKTPFGEIISVDGVVGHTFDGSLEEMAATGEVIVDGKRREKERGFSVIVVETPTLHAPLRQRIDAHAKIIKKYYYFYKITKENSS